MIHIQRRTAKNLQQHVSYYLQFSIIYDFLVRRQSVITPIFWKEINNQV